MKFVIAFFVSVILVRVFAASRFNGEDLIVVTKEKSFVTSEISKKIYDYSKDLDDGGGGRRKRGINIIDFDEIGSGHTTNIFPTPEHENFDANNETLKFLSSIKHACYFLNHTFNVVNELDYTRLNYFLNHYANFFENIPMNNSICRAFKITAKNLENEMENLLSMLENENSKLEQFLLENFIEHYGDKMMNYVLTESFMHAISEAANEEHKHFNDLKTTPQKAVYDFYIGALLTLVKEQALFAKAAEILDVNSPFNAKFVTATLLHHYSTSNYNQTLFDATIDKLKDKSFTNFKVLKNQNFVKFEILFQRLVNSEKNINGDSCDFECDWITRKEYFYNGCEGELRQCQTRSINELEVFYSNDAKKIHGMNKNGASEGTTLYRHNTFWKYLPLGYNCDICECTCDQLKHTLSERFLYAGIVEVENESVITGVRFNKIDGVIFLQLQAGKLDENGYVTKSSVHWMDQPEDLKENVHIVTFDQRKIALQELKFSDKTKTLKGVQIVRNKDNVFAFRIFDDSLQTQLSPAADAKIYEFEASCYSDNFGQETVPYFNADDIVFDPPFEVCGLGFINLKGGFITPYLIGFNPNRFYWN